MNDGPVGEIEKLEARIEELAEQADACRKLILGSRIAMMIGFAWILATLIGVLRMDALQLVTILTLIIGGIVFYGSNTSTLEQKLEMIRALEAKRAELIGAIKLRVVH
jgi:hypothetical protein